MEHATEEIKITDFITEGRDSARTAKELCEITGLKTRDFFAHIETARRAGFPICAAKGKNPGFYLAESREELQAYIEMLTRQEKTTRETRIACAHSLDDLAPPHARKQPPRERKPGRAAGHHGRRTKRKALTM